MNNYTGKIIFFILLACLLVFPQVVGKESFLLYILTVFLFFVVLGAGLNLIMVSGQLSLGHAAFMGIGSYTCALLVVKSQWSFWPSWIAGGLVTGLLALIFGRITLRIKGVYFAILTFAFGEVVRMIFVNTPYFGGTNGIIGIPPPSPINIPGLFQISFDGKIEFYYLTLVFSIICYYIYLRLKRPPIGSVLKSIEEVDLLSECCGINTLRYKLIVFVLASAAAGLVGGLVASFYTCITPASFTAIESIDLVVLNVVGGVASLWGPLFGSMFLVGVPEILRSVKEYQMLVYGVSIILVFYFVPDGIAGFLESKKKKSKVKNNSENKPG